MDNNEPAIPTMTTTQVDLAKNPQKNSEVIYSEDIMQDWHRLFSLELSDGGLFGEQHYKFSSALTLCSSSDSLLHWSRQHVCLTLTGHPQIQTLCKEPSLQACMRVCLSARLLKQNANTVERCSERHRQKKKKKPPESRRTGVVWDYLLQREGGERETDCAIVKLCRRVGLGRNAVLTRQNRFCLLQQSESDTKLYISSTQSANVFNTLQSHINVLLIRHV